MSVNGVGVHLPVPTMIVAPQESNAPELKTPTRTRTVFSETFFWSNISVRFPVISSRAISSPVISSLVTSSPVSSSWVTSSLVISL
nr:hypothetical protein BgiMline_011068 [Biomphalaria glabrata]